MKVDDIGVNWGGTEVRGRLDALGKRLAAAKKFFPQRFSRAVKLAEIKADFLSHDEFEEHLTIAELQDRVSYLELLILGETRPDEHGSDNEPPVISEPDTPTGRLVELD